MADAEDTKLKSSEFDIITLLDVLEHTEDKKTLKEMRRILKNKGIVIIAVPAFRWLWSRWDEILHHQRRYTKKDLEKILLKNNFSIIDITYLYSFLVLPVLIIRFIKQIIFKKIYPSDFQLSNFFINSVLSLLSRSEFFISNKLTIPFGTSILVVARKNE